MDLTSFTQFLPSLSTLTSGLSAFQDFLPVSVKLGALPSSLLSLYLLWLFYLALTNLERAKRAGTLSKTAYGLGLPLLAIGVLIDVFCNVVVMTLLFLELPQEPTVTQRLTRHSDDPGWRGKASRFICQNLLDTFDPSGCHCKKD